jgi:arsenite methyltransferase
MSEQREDYGLDAPTVVRNFLVIGVLLLLVSTTTSILQSTDVMGRSELTNILRINGRAMGIVCLFMSFWMWLSSRKLKHRVAKALLDSRSWSGNETVLDVGCGRGLIAVNAARRVPNGKVFGVDIWQQRDLAGNHPDAILANATAAGVADRVVIDTGDARKLPYPNDHFDVVASMTVIHNIPNAAGRAAAIAECWRVTKPGGQILIFDIWNARSYAKQLRAAGAIDVKLTGPIVLWGLFGWRFSATKPR